MLFDLLLCTDGLTKMLGEDEIVSLLSNTQASPTDMSRQLVDRANENGGKDNTTVVLIRPHRSIPGSSSVPNRGIDLRI